MQYFRPSEFSCKCCGKNEMQNSTLNKLEEARSIATIPFHINSGFRCEAHNRAVGGKDRSAHTKGYAVDIRCNQESQKAILAACKMAGFERIGVSDRFIHVDDDPSLPTPATWRY